VELVVVFGVEEVVRSWKVGRFWGYVFWRGCQIIRKNWEAEEFSDI